jgi:dienelactone hydrolase
MTTQHFLKLAAILGVFLSCLSLPSAVFAKDYSYSQGQEKFLGKLFTANKKSAPGIVLVHNWMGVTAETEKQARRFQALGYTVLAADIYGEGVRPTNPKEAGELATKYKTDRKLLRARLELALNELKKQKGVDSNRLAVLGYCFGGTAALEAARAGLSVKAAISFHGGLDSPTPNDGAQIKSQILALHGAIDPYVSAQDLAAFEAEMQTHKINYELVKYGGAVHSFTDQTAGSDNSKGAAYNAQADERSFQRASEFLKDSFR